MYDDVNNNLNILGSSNEKLIVSKETKNLTSHLYLYKNRIHVNSQNRRRALMLEEQKRKRQDILDRLRFLEDFILEEEEKEEDSSSKTKVSKGCTKSLFKNQIMLSEWLVERPVDFHDWFLVFCPVGKRCIVVSSKGKTKSYSRTGHLISSFPSHLPGGNKKEKANINGNAVLDCIYCHSQKTYYILDVISWNNAQFYDSETELRFYWLATKIGQEVTNLDSTDSINPYKFYLLENYNCDDVSLEKALKKLQFKSNIDGLLFFHKRCHYTPGVTPLVCWLKLEMIPQVLGINISKNEMCEEEMETED